MADKLNYRLTVTDYVLSYNIVKNTDDDDNNDTINCEFLSKILYAAILNKFRIDLEPSEYKIFRIYQDRVHTFIEDLRERDLDVIVSSLEYIAYQDPYLADIIIMLWVTPKPDEAVTKEDYMSIYHHNVLLYQQKMLDLIEHEVVMHFCVETLTKSGSVPIHCIDYLWYYMNNISTEYIFQNTYGGSYITFDVQDTDDIDEMHMIISINFAYMLSIGLGKATYENDIGQKGFFRDLIRKFFTAAEYVDAFVRIPTAKNYVAQMRILSADTHRFFGESFTISVPELENKSKKLI